MFRLLISLPVQAQSTCGYGNMGKAGNGCEISYREMTKDGAIRHPSFKGLREDKNAKDVVRKTCSGN